MVAGLVDGFGLALGWTVFSLLAVTHGGLAAAALYKAAMLIGVVLSAPVTTWLARRLPGRALLTGAALTEVVLRIGTLLALLAGWPAPVIAVGVVVMHVAAWAGFAAMRAEVAAVDDRPRAMTRYALCIAAVEAGGTALAALLPELSRGALGTVVVLYGVSLLPTIAIARRARVTNAPPATAAGAARIPIGILAGGAFIMLLGSGPTLLSVALADELHGRTSVAGAAVAFTAGCLLSSVAVDLVGRLRLPPTLAWPLWGTGMLIGWVAAPAHLVGLFLAQFLAGICLTAFEGNMDARAAREAEPGTVTTVLAWSAATRALGSATAVKLLPLLVVAPAIGLASGTAAAVLAATGLGAWAVFSARPGGGRHRVAAAGPG